MPAKFSLDELKSRMQKSIASLKDELSGLRTGRASASLLEPVTVELCEPGHDLGVERRHRHRSQCDRPGVAAATPAYQAVIDEIELHINDGHVSGNRRCPKAARRHI